MNQILDYNPNKSSGNNSAKSDKVVRVFAIFLALFAVGLLAVGGVSIIKNKKAGESGNLIQGQNTEVKPATKAKITVEQEGEQLNINVVHDKEIKKIVYIWDQGKENNITATGTEVSEKINLIAGEHELTVVVTDVDGVESTYTQVLKSAVGEDKEEPKITIEQSGNKLIVTAKDETEMAFVTYRVNDGEETKFEVEEEGQKEIQFEIELAMYDNNITIVAVDKNNNSKSEIKSYVGLTVPVVQATVSAEKDYVDVTITHETGVKEVMVEINGENSNVDLGGQVYKEVPFRIPITERNNLIKIIAVSVDDTKVEKELEIERPAVEAEDVEIVVQQSELDKHSADVLIKSPGGLKEFRFNVNDVDIPIDFGDADLANLPEFSFPVSLVSGNNKFVITVVKPDDTEKTVTQEIYCED